LKRFSFYNIFSFIAILILFVRPGSAEEIKLLDIGYNPFSQSISINTDKSVKPVISPIDPTGKITVDLPDTTLTTQRNTIEINENYIKNVKVEQIKDKTALTRVSIFLDKPVYYDISTSVENDKQTIQFTSLESSKTEPVDIKLAADSDNPYIARPAVSTAKDIKQPVKAISKGTVKKVIKAVQKKEPVKKGIITWTGPNWKPVKKKVTVPAARPSFLRNKVIVLDPGHGGNDPGAVGPHGIKEKDVTLGISNRLKTKLVDAGANVIMARKDDSEILLQPRVDTGLNNNADIFVSIHCNSSTNSSAYGVETYYKTAQSSRLAKTIQKNLVKLSEVFDRGVKTANFFVIKRTTVPSVLIETGFVSNPVEEMLLASVGYQQKIANAIYNGINEYFINSSV
jgi:N-acetylmuramoyl-L-alanine amidase CwlD